MNTILTNNTIVNAIVLFTTYFCAILTFSKVQPSNIVRKRIPWIVIPSLVVLLILAVNGGIRHLFGKALFILIVFVASISISTNRLSCIPIIFITLSFVFCIEYISVIISSTIIYLINFTGYDVITNLLSSCFQILITIVLINLKRTKQFMLYFSKQKQFEFGLLLSTYVFSFSFLLTQSSVITSETGAILFVGIPLVLTGLILWIRSIVQRYNKNKLKNREDEHTQQEITEKDAKIERLEGEVATLAKQLHRDNHLLSSVERSVQTIAETDSANKRKQLADEFHTLYSERNDMIAKEQQESKILPSTGIAMIDSSLSEMYVKATAHGIAFDLIVGEELYYLVNNIISQTELQTLLCDHIKDAVIAVTATGNTNGRILVTIEKNDGLFEISIRDNGIEFAPDTLAKLGRERITTHADEGGSGIGFMTTFETLAKTKSSLIITEYATETPFTKAVSFVFDGLHRFVIDSYRKDDLKEIVTRDDVILL